MQYAVISGDHWEKQKHELVPGVTVSAALCLKKNKCTLLSYALNFNTLLISVYAQICSSEQGFMRLVFTTILLAFAFSFHLAMRKHHVFDNAFTSFLKMINMMAGEYNFDENFTFEQGKRLRDSSTL